MSRVESRFYRIDASIEERSQLNESQTHRLQEENAAERKRRTASIFRWGWILLVIGFSGYYLAGHGDAFVDHAKALPIGSALLSVGLLLVGKYLVSESARISLSEIDAHFSRGEMYYMYAVSDAAKYLPGGVWGLVGRLSIYSLRKIPLTDSLRAMGLENAWLIISSVFIGVVFSLEYFESILSHEFSVQLDFWVYGVGMVVVLICWVLFLWFLTTIISREKQRLVAILRIVGLQGAIGLLFGLHFSVLIGNADLMFLSIGVFALARALGYLSFFAPAGIGVREAVIVIMLANWLDTDRSLFLAAASRILTVIAELGSLPFIMLTLRPRRF